LNLPEALLQAAQEVPQAEQIALDDCVLATMADKIAAFRAVLARIQQAAGPAVEGDELEPGRGARRPRCSDRQNRVF
jgi:hypothetical protein